MNWTEIPLIEHIEVYDTQCSVYIHTKDRRVIVLHDVRSNGYCDDRGVFIDHVSLGLTFTVFISREDFSHVEYRYSPRSKISKKDFDDLYSYLDEEIEYFTPAESLIEPPEYLYEDLI